MSNGDKLETLDAIINMFFSLNPVCVFSCRTFIEPPHISDSLTTIPRIQ